MDQIKSLLQNRFQHNRLLHLNWMIGSNPSKWNPLESAQAREKFKTEKSSSTCNTDHGASDSDTDDYNWGKPEQAPH